MALHWQRDTRVVCVPCIVARFFFAIVSAPSLAATVVTAWLYVATAVCHFVVEVKVSTVGFDAEKATVIVTGALAALVLAVWALVSSVAAVLAAVWAVSTSVWPLSTEISFQVRHCTGRV